MNIRIFLSSIFVLLVFTYACVKEETYPTSFSFKNGNGTVQNVYDYDAVFDDTLLNVFGLTDESSIRFLFAEGANQLTVGKKELSKEGAYKLIYKKNGETLTAEKGEVHIDYLNRFINFTFKAYFSNGDSITDGVGYQVWLNNNNPLPDLDPPIERDSIEVDTNEWNGIGQGFIYQMNINLNPVYQGVNELTIQDHPESVVITSFYDDTDYTIEIEIQKPIKDLVGKNFDLTQSLQDKIKVRTTYNKYWTDGSENIYDFTEGVFQVINYKDNTLYFGFKGKLQSTLYTWDNNKEIYFCLGKKITW